MNIKNLLTDTYKCIAINNEGLEIEYTDLSKGRSYSIHPKNNASFLYTNGSCVCIKKPRECVHLGYDEEEGMYLFYVTNSLSDEEKKYARVYEYNSYIYEEDIANFKFFELNSNFKKRPLIFTF